MANLDIRSLPAQIYEYGQISPHENSTVISTDLQALKDWLDKQSHIIARRDDQFLVAFLRGCKYSLERAKEKIEMFYTVRTAFPDFFDKLDPLDTVFQKIFKLTILVPLPQPNLDGSRIVFVRPFAYDPQKLHMADIVKVWSATANYLIMNDDFTTINGITSITDLTGMTLAHNSQCTPTLIRKVVICLQEALPFRIKAIHHINAPPIFEMLFKIIHHFLNEKMKKRIFFHKSAEDLFAHIPKAILPKDINGNLNYLEDINKRFMKDIEAKRDWFLTDVKYGTDESKRSKPLKNGDLLFGANGSFRKLNID